MVALLDRYVADPVVGGGEIALPSGIGGIGLPSLSAAVKPAIFRRFQM